MSIQASEKNNNKISIVTAIYNSSGYLDEFIPECLEVFKVLNCSNFEMQKIIGEK
jgi:hypothetical protein